MTTTFGSSKSGDDGQRLLLEDVERGAGDVAGAQRVDQRLGVHEVAAGGVDEPHARAHRGEAAGVDHVARVGGRRQVQRHPVGLPRAPSSMVSARSAPRSRKRSAETNGS